MIAILIVAFFLLFFNIYTLRNQKFIDATIISFLIFSAFIALSTETLSVFNLISFNGIKTLWIISTLFLFFLNKKIKIDYTTLLKSFLQKILTEFKTNSIIINVLFILSILIIFLIFLQGIVYPPNNWDSLSYHLPRIVEWLNHRNLSNYPTHVIRQLYQPSLCEYFILHFNGLTKSDIYSNSVQLFFLIGTIFTTIGISKLIFQKANYFILFIIACTIPHALLEASSTQNDIVHSFFIATSVFFGLKLIKALVFENFIFIGLAVGLALLSKAIAFIFLPILLVGIGVIILFKIMKQKLYKKLYLSGLSILIIISINLPHSYRNYKLSNDFLGTDKTEKTDYLNEQFYPKLIISTVIKNVCLHFDYFYVGNLGNQIAEKSHLILGQNINTPGSNVFDLKYNCNHDWKNHEDTQPNFIHFTLFTFSVVLMIFGIIKRKLNNLNLILLNTLTIATFVFFCAILTWEPWNTRLHLPLFFLMCPSIYYLITSIGLKQVKYIILAQIILYGFYVVIYNYSRPFLTNKETSKIKISDSRYKKYFANQLHIYQDYLNIHSKTKNKKSIGLITTKDTWEYPLFVNHLDKELTVINIQIKNYTKKLSSRYLIPEVIISDRINKTSITINGRKYKNLYLKNKNIWIYK